MSSPFSRIQRAMDTMGVAPLPADKNSNFLRGLGAQVKWPWGPVMGKVSPTLRRSHSQLDTTPPSTRLTVTSKCAVWVGVEDMVYER